MDRHRPGYYKDYAAKRKAEGKPVDRHRPGYYEEYAKKHPEWAAKHQDLLTDDKEDKRLSAKIEKKYCQLPDDDDLIDDYSCISWDEDFSEDFNETDGEISW